MSNAIFAETLQKPSKFEAAYPWKPKLYTLIILERKRDDESFWTEQ
jgi:hypothetical protein